MSASQKKIIALIRKAELEGYRQPKPITLPKAA